MGVDGNEILGHDMYANNGISSVLDFYGNSMSLTVPVYREDEPTAREYITFTANDISLERFVKYWFSCGYANGKYFLKVSTDGTTYNTAQEWTSNRKTQSDDYCWIKVFMPVTNGDVVYLEGCKIIIDNNVMFDGSGNITVGTDVTWGDGAAYLPDVIAS